MNILPEKKIFTLLELVNDWNKLFFKDTIQNSIENNKSSKSSIWSDDVLSYGADNLLPICVVISPKIEMHAYKLKENVGNVSLRDQFANYRLQDKDDYFCRDMIQKIAIREDEYVNSTCLELMNPLDIGYLLSTKSGSGRLVKYEYMELRFLPHKDPDRIIFILGEVVSDLGYYRSAKLPQVSIENLRVLREDKINFENEYLRKVENTDQAGGGLFPAEQLQESARKGGSKLKYDTDLQTCIDYIFNNTDKGWTEFVEMMRNDYCTSNGDQERYTADEVLFDKACYDLYITDDTLYYRNSIEKTEQLIKLTSLKSYFLRAKNNKQTYI